MVKGDNPCVLVRRQCLCVPVCLVHSTLREEHLKRGQGTGQGGAKMRHGRVPTREGTAEEEGRGWERQQHEAERGTLSSMVSGRRGG